MRKKTVIKFIASILLTTELLMWPGIIYAQIAGTGSLNPIPVNQSGSTIDNQLFNAQMALRVTTPRLFCETTIKTFEATNGTARLGLKFATVVGGDGAYVASLKAEEAAYTVYITCMETILTSLNSVVAGNVYTANLKEQAAAQITASIQTYKNKLEQVKGKFDVASENLWKAVLITVLINTTKAVADQLVTKLVNSYKIANIKKYTDSVATLMYNNQFIRDNYPGDAQAQMMSRAIMENPLLRDHIQPGIYVAANNALNYNGVGFSPTNMQYTDPDFYAKMALAGSAQANPYYQQMNYVANLDAARANSLAAARTQIAQGNGYKAPVSCAGSLAQQAQIDQQTKAASNLLENRTKLLNDLQTAKNLGKNVSENDLKRAQADYDNALAAWNKLPFTVAGKNSTGNSAVGGGNNVEGQAAIILCEAVSSPAVLVNQGIDAVFKSMDLGKYNTNNLPGTLSSLAGMATQIGSSMILGGVTGNKAYKINESQLTNQAVTLAAGIVAQELNDNAQNNLAKGVNMRVEVDASNTPAKGQAHIISWDVITSQLQTASYVKVAGPGITDTTSKLPLTGKLAAIAQSSGAYQITVYTVAGLPLTTATQSFVYIPTQAYNSQSNAPQVAGAYTNLPAYTIRGPLVDVGLRGLPE